MFALFGMMDTTSPFKLFRKFSNLPLSSVKLLFGNVEMVIVEIIKQALSHWKILTFARP